MLVAAIFNKPMTVLRYNVLTDLPRDGVFIGGCCILMKMLSGIKKKLKKKYFFVKSQKTELALQFYFCIDVWRTSCVTLQESLLFLHWCYTQRKTNAVLRGVLYSIHIPTSTSVLCSVCFILNTWPVLLKYFMSFSLTKKKKQPSHTTREVYSSLLSEVASEAGSRGWWKGCGGGGLSGEDRMTAMIIKNVLPLPLPEGVPAIPPSRV